VQAPIFTPELLLVVSNDMDTTRSLRLHSSRLSTTALAIAAPVSDGGLGTPRNFDSPATETIAGHHLLNESDINITNKPNMVCSLNIQQQQFMIS